MFLYLFLFFSIFGVLTSTFVCSLSEGQSPGQKCGCSVLFLNSKTYALPAPLNHIEVSEFQIRWRGADLTNVAEFENLTAVLT
jgi:hypothetical protein